jgi:Ricin-type beta-trefoil lectin domain
MSARSSRAALVSAGTCALLLSLAIPALASTAPPATAARPAVPATSPSLRAAMPSPEAPHSATAVPGITGTAARENDPPLSASQRFAQLNAGSQVTAGPTARASAAAPKVRAGTAAPAALTPWTGQFHGYWGVDPDQTIYGVQATQSLNPGLVAPTATSDFIYAPTLDPSGIDTIEMSTIYDSGGNYVGAWDWGAASPGFAKTAAIDSTFLATYATQVNGQYFYSVQNVQTDPTANTWTAYLYNYTTDSWDTFYSSSNMAKLSNSGGGWDMDEVYTSYNSSTGEGSYCTLSDGDVFESTGLQYQLSSGGAWTPATTSDSTTNLAYPRGSDLGCTDLGYTVPAQNTAFAVTNGTHSGDAIVGSGSQRCIDTNQVKFANGTKEQLWNCNGGAGQTWSYNANGELTVDGGKYCLDATGEGTTNGTKLQLWTCNGTTNQEWSFSANNALVGIGSGKCVDATGEGTADGTQLQLWTCDNTSNQQWAWS